jgi:hypothetical protein
MAAPNALLEVHQELRLPVAVLRIQPLHLRRLLPHDRALREPLRLVLERAGVCGEAEERTGRRVVPERGDVALDHAEQQRVVIRGLAHEREERGPAVVVGERGFAHRRAPQHIPRPLGAHDEIRQRRVLALQLSEINHAPYYTIFPRLLLFGGGRKASRQFAECGQPHGNTISSCLKRAVFPYGVGDLPLPGV